MPLTKRQNDHTAPGTATGAVLGGALGHHEGHTAVGTALGGAAGHHFAGNHQPVNPAVRPAGIHDPQQMTAPGATTAVDGAAIPAAGVMNNRNQTSATERAFVGKLEHAAGTLLCSSSLRAKGIQKEQEAQALKVQSAELAAAERLEQEAMARRERAVAHGAHPDIMNSTGANNNQANAQYATNPAISNPSTAPNGAGAYDGRYPNVPAPLS